MAEIRLYVEAGLGKGAAVPLGRAQSHYLSAVMRLGVGDRVLLFNGRDGEWRARIATQNRTACDLAVEAQTRPQTQGADLWLAFAPIKRARIDLVAEKATELGVAVLQPVMTRRTDVARINLERLRAHTIEAAEQCGRLDVPELREPVALDRLIAGWPSGRRLLVCDETGGGTPIAAALADALDGAPGGGGSHAPWAILTGPEGGFDPAELDALAKLPIVTRAGLGPLILRADTAAVAALACWQALIGTWRP